jgi:hypothetical protein
MDNLPPRASSSLPAPDEPAWKSVLQGRSPREILARLVEGDPLDLRGRCEARVRSQALLIDVHRLHLRCSAHVARHAVGYSGQPHIDIWLGERLRTAVQELLRESAELVTGGGVPEPPDDERLLLIASTFGMDPSSIGRACVSFNRQPYPARAAFHGLILEGCDPAAWCAEQGVTLARATESLRSALWALGVRDGPDIDELLRGDEHDE